MCDAVVRLNFNGEVQFLTCSDLKLKRDFLLHTFRLTNRSDIVESCNGIDRSFVRYKEEIDIFLAKCISGGKE